jgi:gamma-glutamyltranspeptidase
MVASGKSVGVPGLLAMLEEAHRRHGKLKWERLLSPAVRLAENGFPVSPRLNQLLGQDTLLRNDAAARALYYQADGEPLRVGDTLRNPELALMLRRVAAEGSAALQRGATAERIVAAVANRGGGITSGDLRDYRPLQREAVCGSFAAGASAACRRHRRAASASCNCSASSSAAACLQAPGTRRCGPSFSPRPDGWFMPIAPVTSAIRISFTSRSGNCWRTTTSSGAARLIDFRAGHGHAPPGEAFLLRKCAGRR